MRKLIFTLIACLFLLVNEGTAQQRARIFNFGWLAGCWEYRDGKKDLLINEQWMRPAGTSMLGIGRTVRASRTVDFEFVRIEVRGSDVFYIARPMENTSETNFRLIRETATELVFENPEHDFPQRVIYRRVGKRSLNARVEGTKNGKTRGIDFRYTRVKCE